MRGKIAGRYSNGNEHLGTEAAFMEADAPYRGQVEAPGRQAT